MARFSNPTSQYLDGNGDPFPGNKLFFFEPGTTTDKDTFSDSGLTTANANPVIADADGRIPSIFLDGTYKVVLKDTDDVTIWTRDPIGDTTSGQWTSWLNDVTYNIPEIVLGSDDDYYRSLTDANQGNDPTSSAANWEQLELGRIWNTNVTYALGGQAIGSDGMLYFSLVASNTANNPTSDGTSTNWRAADQIRSVDAGGTVDAITATYIPAVAVLKDELILRVRASGANATTTPTFAPNGLTAKTIVKLGNQALDIGDISGAGHELLLVHNSTNDNWELINAAVNTNRLLLVGVNFNGIGTVAIRDSFNVTSITDNGTGDYTINFTTALGNANYYPSISSDLTIGVGNNTHTGYGNFATGSLGIQTSDSAGAGQDHVIVVANIFGDA